MILFNPGDNHACIQCSDQPFHYCSLNLSKNVMLDVAEEITGKRELPGFSINVLYDDDITYYFYQLQKRMLSDSMDFGKEESFLFLISALLQKYGKPFESCIPECRYEIDKACEFIRQHFNEHLYLDQICHYAGLSKSTLLRAFTKSKGITPYRYLETIRINKAKELLESGMSSIEVAMQTGFSDQSHFTHYFNKFIGLSPRIYREIFLDKHKGGA